MLITKNGRIFYGINFSIYDIQTFIEKMREKLKNGEYDKIELGTIEDEDGIQETLFYTNNGLEIGGEKIVKGDQEDYEAIFSQFDYEIWANRFDLYRELPEDIFDKIINARWENATRLGMI